MNGINTNYVKNAYIISKGIGEDLKKNQEIQKAEAERDLEKVTNSSTRMTGRTQIEQRRNDFIINESYNEKAVKVSGQDQLSVKGQYIDASA